MFSFFNSMKSDGETLKILQERFNINAKEIAPKGSLEYKNLIAYMKAMREVGMKPDFMADQLAYNYNNHRSLTRLESTQPTQNQPKSALDETIELSRKLPSTEKLEVSKLILNKLLDLAKITARFDPALIETIETQTIEAEQAWKIEGEHLTPSDLAMFYLFQLAEASRELTDFATHIEVTSSMSNLLDVAPKGALSKATISLPLKARTNDPQNFETSGDGHVEKNTKPENHNACEKEPSYEQREVKEPLLDELELDAFGDEIVSIIRRSCSDIFTMKITCDDDFNSPIGSVTPKEIDEWGEETIETIRVIAELVRVKLGGEKLSELDCRPLELEEIELYGADFINLVTKIAYTEIGLPQKFEPLRIV